MAKTLKSWKSEQDDGSFAIPMAVYSDVVVLVANTPQTVTTPSDANSKKATKVLFTQTGGADFWADTGATCTITAGVDGSKGVLNPTARILSGTDTQITLVSVAGCTVNLQYFL